MLVLYLPNVHKVGVFIFLEKGPEKKARQFDFMAMFEEARKTAIERTNTVAEGNLIVWTSGANFTSARKSHFTPAGVVLDDSRALNDIIFNDVRENL